MNRLLLLRHARAAWAEPGTRDFDRPLSASGESDARTLGGLIASRGLIPGTVLCSTAARARQTWERVARTPGGESVRTIRSDALYNTDAAGCLTMIRQAPEAESLLVVGHNPVMEDLAVALSGDGAPEAMKRVSAGFPACGLAVISFPAPLSAITPGTGFLETFLVPDRP